jgi:copper chaperone
MALRLNVPSMTGADAAQTIKDTILTTEPDAKINVDLDEKTITVESQASEETIKQLITAAGHHIA